MAGFSYPENTKDVGLVEGCDCGNTHSYPGGGSPVFRLTDWYIPMMQNNSGPSKPLCATETGYHNAVNKVDGHWIQGVSERAASKYLTRLFLEYFNRGFSRVYIYEFMDEGMNPEVSELNFGLIRADGTRKAQFNALRNMVDLLEEPGTNFVPGALDYTLSGNLEGIGQTLLQKQDGSFVLALWLDAESFNFETKLDVDSSRPVTVTLNTKITSATTYLPADSVAPAEQFTAPATLELMVPDHPLLIQLIPAVSDALPVVDGQVCQP
jgi:hypothetical protein